MCARPVPNIVYPCGVCLAPEHDEFTATANRAVITIVVGRIVVEGDAIALHCVNAAPLIVVRKIRCNEGFIRIRPRPTRPLKVLEIIYNDAIAITVLKRASQAVMRYILHDLNM